MKKRPAVPYWEHKRKSHHDKPRPRYCKVCGVRVGPRAHYCDICRADKAPKNSGHPAWRYIAGGGAHTVSVLPPGVDKPYRCSKSEYEKWSAEDAFMVGTEIRMDGQVIVVE